MRTDAARKASPLGIAMKEAEDVAGKDGLSALGVSNGEEKRKRSVSFVTGDLEIRLVHKLQLLMNGHTVLLPSLDREVGPRLGVVSSVKRHGIRNL